MLILQVWLEASIEPVGYLIKGDDGDLSFTYNGQWLADPNSHALSLSLPLGKEPFGDVPVRAWFGNLLHENDQLETTMARYGIERSDIAGLLEHLGADCPGAVSVLGLDQPPVKRPGTLSEDYDPLDESTLRDIVERLATGKPLPDGMRDPSPVAGVRRKVSLAALPDGRFTLPKHGTGAPTTHILKLPDRQNPKEARDEAFLTDLAAKCGFSVGTCVADQIGGHDILLINRFDRLIDGDKVYRLHVEDFAQASGLPSDLKYERRGEAGRRFDATTIGRISASRIRLPRSGAVSVIASMPSPVSLCGRPPLANSSATILGAKRIADPTIKSFDHCGTLGDASIFVPIPRAIYPIPLATAATS